MIRILLSTLSIVYLLSSCIVSEDMHFADNGAMKYQLSIDMSQLVQGTGMANLKDDKIPLERVSIAQMLKDSIGDISDLSDEHKQILKDVEPFYFQAKIDDEKGEFALNIEGEFKNADEFNVGLAALGKTQKLESVIKKKNDYPLMHLN